MKRSDNDMTWPQGIPREWFSVTSQTPATGWLYYDIENGWVRGGQRPAWEGTQYIRTHSGLKFHPRFIESLEVRVEDIAYQLARVNRYNGCLDTDVYSVAQHSIIVHDLVLARFERNLKQLGVPPSPFVHSLLALQALFHDASEAYMPDLPSPYKELVPDYVDLENKIQEEILRQLDIDGPISPLVKQVDKEVRATEMRSLQKWDEPHPAPGSDLDFYILPMSSKEAEAKFLERYEAITRYE
jgi:hypothetical protein